MCLWETCLIMLAASKKACGRRRQRGVGVTGHPCCCRRRSQAVTTVTAEHGHGHRNQLAADLPLCTCACFAPLHLELGDQMTLSLCPRLSHFLGSRLGWVWGCS